MTTIFGDVRHVVHRRTEIRLLYTGYCGTQGGVISMCVDLNGCQEWIDDCAIAFGHEVGIIGRYMLGIIWIWVRLERATQVGDWSVSDNFIVNLTICLR